MRDTATAGAPGRPPPSAGGQSDPRLPLDRLLRDLRTSSDGLSQREATRRLTVYGPNLLVRRGGRRWPRELLAQLIHPLAVLLMLAAALAGLNDAPGLAVAIVAVVVLNAAFAFVQERQAERSVEALADYLPPHAHVVRDGQLAEIEARLLVPGDVLVIGEGDRVCADARLLDGDVQVDLSMLTGESVPVSRSASWDEPTAPLLAARDVLFSGTVCTAGQARAVVTGTGMHTELGRIAALTERVRATESPLEHQVKRVAWLIAAVAIGAGIAFLPLGLAAGLPLAAAVSFAIGLLVANVPEGLLPTITLALAIGVRDLARRGAVIKRLSAVETLGCTTVICTDKTGTLTCNRMRVVRLWADGVDLDLERSADPHAGGDTVRELVRSAAVCTTATLSAVVDAAETGDPTELALLRLAGAFHVAVPTDARDKGRRHLFAFDSHLKLMSTVDATPDGDVSLHTKGAPEQVLARATTLRTDGGVERPLTEADQAALQRVVADYAGAGLRVLAVARRELGGREQADAWSAPRRDEAEHSLGLLGLVAMVDPPRPEVAAAIGSAHRAGIRVHVVTGDYGPTAAAIARQVGIGERGSRVITGAELEAMSESELDAVLSCGQELIFARSTPEAKLRIADALRAQGEVVAMTGDGVNDAPALRRADIGVAMGRSGTDVAREAATLVLTDDNFATIVAAVEAGRRVYANVRRFILYIFTHAVPEVAPFLLFALAGGAVPLPLTVMQVLAVDLGTDTLPALALSREAAEPGLMDRRPRRRSQGVIDRGLLWRAWGFLGSISALLVLGGFFTALLAAGWHPGAAVGPGTPLHHGYQQATTVTWLGIVACQIGAAFAARTDHASLRQVGLRSNPRLLAGVGVALVFAAAVTYLPPLQRVFGTAALGPAKLLLVLPFPFVVWGADELRRWRRRRRVEAVSDPRSGGCGVGTGGRTQPSTR